jgi:hypothetical protein
MSTSLRTKNSDHANLIIHQNLIMDVVKPFGLKGAPATFERLMETVLAGLQWDICLIGSVAIPASDITCPK